MPLLRRRLHEEIFEMQAGATPGGVDGEVESKARGFAFVVRNQAFEERMWPKAIAAEFGFADLDCIGLAFVGRERMDQGEDCRDVGFGGEADVHGGCSRHRVYGTRRPGKAPAAREVMSLLLAGGENVDRPPSLPFACEEKRWGIWY